MPHTYPGYRRRKNLKGARGAWIQPYPGTRVQPPRLRRGLDFAPASGRIGSFSRLLNGKCLRYPGTRVNSFALRPDASTIPVYVFC
eukprot:2898197-Rhodomonas_salina.1